MSGFYCPVPSCWLAVPHSHGTDCDLTGANNGTPHEVEAAACQRCEALEGALRELVTLKDLVKHQDYPEYLARKEAAWANARAFTPERGGP